ncbi:hypothetical protein BD410DRAFT_809158, partial [Rickenella mellea]
MAMVGVLARLYLITAHTVAKVKVGSDSMWQYDMYNGPGKTLSSRLTDPSSASFSAGGGGPRKVETSLVQNALGQATTAVLLQEDCRLKGVQVRMRMSWRWRGSLAIFKRGHIFKPLVHHATGRYVVVGLTFTKSDEAKNDVKFSGLLADRL